MLGKAMLVVTMCTLAFAICGKANRDRAAAVANAHREDFEPRVGKETTPVRKSSSTSSTQVRRFAKILAAASVSRGAQSAGVPAAIPEDKDTALDHAALNVPVGGIFGPPTWEKNELVLDGFEDDLLGWQEKKMDSQDKGDLKFIWGVMDQGVEHHERSFGVSRRLKTRGPKDEAAVQLEFPNWLEKFLKRGLFLKGMYAHADGLGIQHTVGDSRMYTHANAVQTALDMDKFPHIPAWLEHVFTRPSVIVFMADNIPAIKQYPPFKDAVKVILAATILDANVKEAVQGLAGFFLDNPDIERLELNLNQDLVKAMDIMTDA